MFGVEDLAVAAFRFIYRRRSPSALGERRPWFKWFPKYRADLELPPGILDAEDPQGELEARVGELGFRFDAWTKEAVRFTRGKSWGDFSAKLIKLELRLPYPLERKSSLRLEVSGVCLFDTGDLRKLSHDWSNGSRPEVAAAA